MDEGETYLEPHNIPPMVQCNPGVMAIHVCQITFEETRERISTVPGRNWPTAFKRSKITHLNGVTTRWKRAGKVSRENTEARASILEEDLSKSVSLSFHTSVCRKRETRAKMLSNHALSLREQKDWMQSYGKWKPGKR